MAQNGVRTASRRAQVIVVSGLVAVSGGAWLLVPNSTLDASSPDGPIVRGAAAAQAAYHDASPPLRVIPAARRQPPRQEQDEAVLPHPATVPGANDPVVQSSLSAPLVPATATNWDGVGAGFSGPQGSFAVQAAPPDTNGAVGPNHYVQLVNTDLAIFNKTGTVLYGPVPINTLWSGFGGLCQNDNDGDPTVRYDRLAGRWIISQFAVTGANGSGVPYLQCVAVSQTGDPTGAYNRYAFGYSAFPDYPKLGVWPDAYYTTFNLFNGNTFTGGLVCAYDRTAMLNGQAATQQCFNVGGTYGGLLPADLDSATAPPAGAPNYVVALGAAANQLELWKFHVDWSTPANSTLAPYTVTTAAYTLPCPGGTGGTCVPQAGTGQQLDTLGDRLMYRLAYRNFGDHESLVVDHSVAVGASGVGIRWYEIRLPGGAPSVYQQGTYAPDSSFRWLGSIAQDGAGNLALGFSIASSSLSPQIRYTGRLAGDALGQLTQGEATIIAGGGSQTSNLSRWGDYSSMDIDPTDDCTFWYTTEYIPSNGTFNWRTRIASFQFPSCASAPTPTPTPTPTPAPTPTPTPTPAPTPTPTPTGGVIANPGFETGSLTGWTTSGATSVVTTAHTGTYAARGGSTSPTGTSSIAQTFTIPSGATSLSFWYQVYCPDSVTYDWATATLRDNTTATTTTMLGRTCTRTGTWVQVSANVSALVGHSVTLTLTNRDDNYAGDPTYTLYDDVRVQ